MFYAIISEDVENSLELRTKVRPAHLARLQALKNEGRLLLAGPHPLIDSESYQSLNVGVSDVQIRAIFGRARITRRCEQLFQELGLAKLPSQGVLATATTHQQDLHDYGLSEVSTEFTQIRPIAQILTD